MQAARAKSEEGHAANKAGHFVVARDAFAAASRLVPPGDAHAKERATWLFSSGNMSLKIDDFVAAKATYQEVLGMPKLDAGIRTKAQEKLADPRLAASAGASAAAADAAKAKAREGHSAHEASDFATARRLFEEAHELTPAGPARAKERATYLFSSGNMALKGGEFELSRELYNRVLALPNLDGEIRAKAEQKLTDPRVAAIGARAAAPSTSDAAANFFKSRRKVSSDGVGAGVPAASPQKSAAAVVEVEAQLEAQRREKADRATAAAAKAEAARAQAAAAERQLEETRRMIEAEQTRSDSQQSQQQLAAAQQQAALLEEQRRCAEEAKAAVERTQLESSQRVRDMEAALKVQEEAAAARQAAAKAEMQEEIDKLRQQHEADEAAKQRKAAEEAQAQALELERAEAEKASRAEAALAAAEASKVEARQRIEERLKREKEERERAGEENARRVQQELERARASMAQFIEPTAGHRGSRGRVQSVEDLGAPLPDAPDGYDGPKEIGASYPPGMLASMASKGKGRARGLLSCGGKSKARLAESAVALSELQAQLDRAMAEKRRLEDSNRRLVEKSVALQEKAAKEIAEARAAQCVPSRTERSAPPLLPPSVRLLPGTGMRTCQTTRCACSSASSRRRSPSSRASSTQSSNRLPPPSLPRRRRRRRKPTPHRSPCRRASPRRCRCRSRRRRRRRRRCATHRASRGACRRPTRRPTRWHSASTRKACWRCGCSTLTT